jgi:hypothetical protein
VIEDSLPHVGSVPPPASRAHESYFLSLSNTITGRSWIAHAKATTTLQG